MHLFLFFIFVVFLCWLRVTNRLTTRVKLLIFGLVTLLLCVILAIVGMIDNNSYPNRLQRQAEDYYGSMPEEDYDALMEQVDEVMRQQRGF